MKLWLWILVLGCVAGISLASEDTPHPLFRYDLATDWTPGMAENHLEKQINEWQETMTRAGVHPFLSYWGDFLGNPVGGLSQENDWTQLLVFGTELNLETFFRLPGASLTVSGTYASGGNLSESVGNVFTLSQAVVMDAFALYNLYYKQKLFDDRLHLHLGRLSAGQYFATLPAMGLGVSGAVNGNPTSLFLNAPFHSTAGASWAAHGKWTNPQSYVEAGIFQASPRIGNPAYHGADFSIRSGDGMLLMAEMGWTPEFGTRAGSAKETAHHGLKGVYTFGAYFADYQFDRFSGGTQDSTFGFYWLAQQKIWQAETNLQENLTLWGGLTYSPQEQVAQMPWMLFGGAVWQGPLPGRDQDNLLLSIYMGKFSNAYADAQALAGLGNPTMETVFELSYIVQLTQHLQFQPDLQWVLRPGGTGSIPNAVVLGFQLGVTF